MTEPWKEKKKKIPLARLSVLLTCGSACWAGCRGSWPISLRTPWHVSLSCCHGLPATWRKSFWFRDNDWFPPPPLPPPLHKNWCAAAPLICISLICHKRSGINIWWKLNLQQLDNELIDSRLFYLFICIPPPLFFLPVDEKKKERSPQYDLRTGRGDVWRITKYYATWLTCSPIANYLWH